MDFALVDLCRIVLTHLDFLAHAAHCVEQVADTHFRFPLCQARVRAMRPRASLRVVGGCRSALGVMFGGAETVRSQWVISGVLPIIPALLEPCRYA